MLAVIRAMSERRIQPQAREFRLAGGEVALGKVRQHPAAMRYRAGCMEPPQRALHQLDPCRRVAQPAGYPTLYFLAESHPLRELVLLRQGEDFRGDAVGTDHVALKQIDQSYGNKRECQSVRVVAPPGMLDTGIGKPGGLIGKAHQRLCPSPENAANHSRVLAVSGEIRIG